MVNFLMNNHFDLDLQNGFSTKLPFWTWNFPKTCPKINSNFLKINGNGYQNGISEPINGQFKNRSFQMDYF